MQLIAHIRMIHVLSLLLQHQNNQFLFNINLQHKSLNDLQSYRKLRLTHQQIT